MLAPFHPDSESADLFRELHRPFEFTPFVEMFHFMGGSHSVRDYMPNCCTDYSPFVVRQRETKKHEEALLANVSKNSFVNFFWGSGKGSVAAGGGSAIAESSVSMNGMSSPSKNPSVNLASSATSSNNSDESETEDDEDDLSTLEEFGWLIVGKCDDSEADFGGHADDVVRYQDLFDTCEENCNGFKVEPPSENDLFERYCSNSRKLPPINMPYTDASGRRVFPFVRESNRDEFLSDDVKKLRDDGGDFCFKPMSKKDMGAFVNYGKLTSPLYLEQTGRAALREFAMMINEFRNQIY
jgi:hypothetical protein